MKSIETKIAEQNVDASITNFEHAVGQLIEKVEDTAHTVNRRITTTRETIERPIVIARQVRQRIEDNPVPFAWGLFYMVGLYIGLRMVRQNRRRSDIHVIDQSSWAQLEP